MKTQYLLLPSLVLISISGCEKVPEVDYSQLELGDLSNMTVTQHSTLPIPAIPLKPLYLQFISMAFGKQMHSQKEK
jgi:hypothetical protein